jgi:hypothetical protein
VIQRVRASPRPHARPQSNIHCHRSRQESSLDEQTARYRRLRTVRFPPSTRRCEECPGRRCPEESARWRCGRATRQGSGPPHSAAYAETAFLGEPIRTCETAGKFARARPAAPAETSCSAWRLNSSRTEGSSTKRATSTAVATQKVVSAGQGRAAASFSNRCEDGDESMARRTFSSSSLPQNPQTKRALLFIPPKP